MDFSKLGQNEKLALYGAIAVFLAGLVSNWGGLLWLSILAALGAAVVLFLPQMSPKTSLPGSSGSLLAVLGFVALGAALIELLRYLGYTFETLGRFSTLLFLVALAGSAVMAWAGWQALQSEGGKWALGGSSATTTGAAAPPPPAPPTQEPMATPAESAAMAPDPDPSIGAADTVADDAPRRDDEDRSAG
jgi:hypothetical protein